MAGLTAGLLLTACSQAGYAPAAPSSVPEPLEGELGRGWDEEPEPPPIVGQELVSSGEHAQPDSSLGTKELLDILRLPATAAASNSFCKPQDVDVSVQYADAATGSRYGLLWVQNTSDKDCTVQGYPGFGARGAWGSKFLFIAEQIDAITYEDPAAEQVAVTLAPGQFATANMTWTGELAGAYSEPISLFVVQLASNQVPIGIPVIQDFVGDGSQPQINSALDIGMLSTVSVGPLQSSESVPTWMTGYSGDPDLG